MRQEDAWSALANAAELEHRSEEIYSSSLLVFHVEPKTGDLKFWLSSWVCFSISYQGLSEMNLQHLLANDMIVFRRLIPWPIQTTVSPECSAFADNWTLNRMHDQLCAVWYYQDRNSRRSLSTYAMVVLPTPGEQWTLAYRPLIARIGKRTWRAIDLGNVAAWYTSCAKVSRARISTLQKCIKATQRSRHWVICSRF